MTTTTSVGVDAARSLAALVADVPDRARVLDELGLEYCCHGQRSLADACAAAGLDPEQVAASLASVRADGPLPYSVEPAALADHIEAVHHAYLHAELPALAALASKVVAVHGGRHSELSRLQRLVGELGNDLEPHLAKEERVLFPAIRALTRGEHDFPFMTVRNPVRMMTAEHDRAGQLLDDLRGAARGYAVPGDACASYRSLYERLAFLEQDTHRHIHLENNVLFPAAVALEDHVRA